jgi:diguanylate cyclase (GGDEF)-like protein
MQIIVTTGIMFFIFSFFFVSGFAHAQENTAASEALSLTRIELLYEQENESPFDIIQKINPIIDVCEKYDWERACLHAYTLKIEALLASTDINEAEKMLNHVIPLANKLDDPIILIRLELVDLNVRDSKGFFEGITTQHSSLLAKASTIESPALAGKIYHEVGDSQFELLDYTGALVSLEKAYESYQSVNDLQAVGSVLNTLANVNTTLQNTDAALHYLEKALAISRESNNKFASSIVLFNIGGAYSTSENITKAREYMQQALQLSIDINDELGVAWAIKELANYDVIEENWQNAIDLYTDIEPVFVKSGISLPLFETFTGQASAYLAVNKLEIATQKANQAQHLLEKLKDPIHRIDLHKISADIAYAKHDFKEAFDILAENYEFATDFYLEKKQNEIEKHSIRFNSELKEKENQALIIQNKLNSLQINKHNAEQRLWWLVAGISCLLLITVGLMLIIQTRNRNHFKSMALNDHLTNSPNRRAILEYAELRFYESTRTEQAVTIGIIDIDNFKALNDTYGHKVGDDVLVAFATACKKIIRQYDKFGRYGGEEWLFVFANTSSEEISTIFVRIRDEFNRKIQQKHHKLSTVTFSMGVATYHKETDETPQTLINRADKKLYEAKSLGKDQIVFHTNDLT